MNVWNAIESVGWTLVHFLWQGAAVALVLAVLLRILRSPASRYSAGAISLAVLA
ncbi:MAG: M56 family peptidase, partial [Verrucomicrobiales bacterium]|nr:M56 family peptidase [Verrucomicrobiales bacterium]